MAMLISQVRHLKIFICWLPPLYPSHPIHSRKPSLPHPRSPCHCPGSDSRVCCLSSCVGFVIVLPASTLFSRDFILCLWPEWHFKKTGILGTPSTKFSTAPSFPRKKLHYR